jgi:hypothetical protein
VSTYERDRSAFLAGYLHRCHEAGVRGSALHEMTRAASALADRYARAEDVGRSEMGPATQETLRRVALRRLREMTGTQG